MLLQEVFCTPEKSRSGEIGRRARLRIWYGDMCRFKSCLRHLITFYGSYRSDRSYKSYGTYLTIILETKLHEKSQVLRELEIFIGEDEVAKAFDEAYKTIRPKITLPGFRPGKAPMSGVKKMHGDAIEGDTLEK